MSPAPRRGRVSAEHAHILHAVAARGAAREVVPRNMLQRKGFEGIDVVRAAGRQAGREEGLRAAIAQVCASRGLALSDAQRVTLGAPHDEATLERRLSRAATAARADEVFVDP